MLKNFFKNFVKTSLVLFLALVLSNFLPSVIQQKLSTPSYESTYVVSHQVDFLHEVDENQNSINVYNNLVKSLEFLPVTYANTSVISSGLQEVQQAISDGQYAEAIRIAKEKIVDLLPIVNFLKTISYPIFIVIGALLDNQIFSSPVMRDVLGNVWSQVRNLCYYILIGYFVFIAIYNVFAGSSDSQYSLKKGLQEIAIAMVLINFSWYGSMVVLDVSNVAINITYSWATEYQNNNTLSDQSSVDQVADICKLTQLKSSPVCTNQNLKTDFQNFLGKIDQRSIPLNMAIRFGKVLEVDKIDPSTIDSATNPFTLVAVFLVKIFIFIVQFFAYIMLAYYLIIRIIYIWVYIALSPIIVLDKVMSGLSIDASEHFQKFFDYALIGPIKGGVGFTLSYIILDSITRTPAVYQDSQVLDAVALSIGSLDSFQSLLVYFASIAVIYEITLNMADGTAAAGAFSWLRSKVEGTGKFVASMAANTGVFLGGNSTSAKQLGSKFFPTESMLTNNPGATSGSSSGSSTPAPILSTDTATQIVDKLDANPSLKLDSTAMGKIVADPTRLKTSTLTPNQLIASGKDAAARKAASDFIRTFTSVNKTQAFRNQIKAFPKPSP